MKYTITSGYFSPLHKGHIDSFKDAIKIAPLIVIVNNDNQLVKKRGKAFMDELNRKEIVDNIKGVVETYIAIDKDSTVCETLKLIRKLHPNDELIFCKGGDRNNGNTPEDKTCNENDIKILFNCGGGKTYSSRNFLRDWTNFSKELNEEQLKKFNLEKE